MPAIQIGSDRRDGAPTPRGIDLGHTGRLMQLRQPTKFPSPIAAEHNLADFGVGREGGQGVPSERAAGHGLARHLLALLALRTLADRPVQFRRHRGEVVLRPLLQLLTNIGRYL